MKMYWLPRLEIIEYLPVRSEYVVPASFVSRVKKALCLRLLVRWWLCFNFQFFFIVLVERVFCCSSFKLTLRVGRERVRCLEISFELRPGHVIKFQLFIS